MQTRPVRGVQSTQLSQFLPRSANIIVGFFDFFLFKAFGNTLFTIPYIVQSARIFDWKRYFDRCFLNNYIGL